MIDFVQQNTETKKSLKLSILEEKERHEKQLFISGKVHSSKSKQKSLRKS
jgi:hypothetical protein